MAGYYEKHNLSRIKIEININNIITIQMSNKYEIKFNNNVPKWNELSFENSGTNQSFIKANIFMEVYEKDELIYSIILEIINGNYYCQFKIKMYFYINKNNNSYVF